MEAVFPNVTVLQQNQQAFGGRIPVQTLIHEWRPRKAKVEAGVF